MGFSQTTPEPARVFTMKEIPPNTIVIILTNCQGEWLEKGFGAFLKHKFPGAYGRYRAICDEYASGDHGTTTRDLVGTCQIIPPLSYDFIARSAPRVYIACLFSSYGNGRRNWFSLKRGRDSKAKILAQTDSALAHLKELLKQKGREHSTGNLFDTNWTATGKNMLVLAEDNNPKDFHLKCHEVEALIRKNFEDWDGEIWMWDQQMTDRAARYESLLAYLDPRASMI
ncbi:hypothetical protein F5Y05DRAFT_417508 [Hypoxylon sp. FL0543]|nr:hypothetical protein F5Y05DRAFT_417508 [Hypoxylon sp. FL0543]